MTTTKHSVGSELPVDLVDLPKPGALSDAAAELAAGSFSTYWTWRANGVYKHVPFTHPLVKANSRVFVSISEYAANPQSRFIGDARMAVYNVAPRNGGFDAWVDISWGSPLNVRFDVLVDP
jgi:hypothetical protein